MPGDRCLETHKMAEVDGPEQGTVVLDGIVQVVAGGVDPRQVLGVDKAQDMVHDLEGQRNHLGLCFAVRTYLLLEENEICGGHDHSL